MNMARLASKLLRSTFLAAELILFPQVALAHIQDAPSAPADAASAGDEATIVVTGSRVARSDATAATPISVVGDQQLAEAGNLSISDVLRKDPALGSLTRGPSAGLNGAGINAVDLRNLGNRRSLVLIDGRRYPKFSDILGNSGQDISGIPAIMIDRIEVLRDGASTAYGADAVAGVVNFILRDRFEGVRVDAFSGISDEGDGFAYRLAGLFGARSDRASIVIGAQYQHQDNIQQDERDWAFPLITGWQADGAPIFNGGSTSITPGGRVTAATALGGSPAGAVLACYPIGGGTTNLAPACEAYDPAPQSSLYSGFTIKSAGAVGRYEMTEDIELRFEGFWSNRDASQDISAQQINLGSSTGAFPSGFVIPATNANNPYGRDIRFTWRPAQYGARPTVTDSTTIWAMGAVRGRIFGDFNWEISHSYGETDSHQRTSNQVNSVSLFNLLNPAACASDPVCAPIGAIPNVAALLQQTTPLTLQQQGYLFEASTARIRFVSEQTMATLTGDLFELPAGSVGLAVGFEHRAESGRILPDDLVQSGALVGSTVLPGGGSFNTEEAFAELDVPLLRDQPFARELSLNLQGRYSHFSNFGGAETYKVGLNWAPTSDIRFRGAYGTSFRAPDVLELYAGGGVSTGGFQDPCNAGGLRLTNPTVTANCAALGVPADFNQPQPNLPQRGGGNPGLEPERGRTYTTLTADYYNIRIRDAIRGTNVQANLNQCYSDPGFLTRAANPNDICFGFADRGPTSALPILNVPPINSGTQKTSGLDMSLQYVESNLPVPGRLDLALRLSHLFEFAVNGVDYKGSYPSPGTFVDGFSNFPRWRGSAQVAYSAEPFTVQWTTTFVNRMRDFFVGTVVPADNTLGYDGTPRYFSHDLLVRIEPTENSTFTFGVNNLFDKEPPYAFITTRNTLPSVFDVIGRYFFVTASYRF
jgi:iron complex outermembrane receptor protein